MPRVRPERRWIGVVAMVLVAASLGIRTSSAQDKTTATRELQSLVKNSSLGAKGIAKLRELIKAGADVNAITESGYTPLALMAWSGQAEAVKLLLAAKANVNAADEDGWTPLLLAAGEGRTAVVKLLLEAQANVNAADKNGVTPLLVASRGHTEVVRLLLAANVNAAAKNGLTPLAIASKKGHAQIVSLLRQAQAGVKPVIYRYRPKPPSAGSSYRLRVTGVAGGNRIMRLSGGRCAVFAGKPVPDGLGSRHIEVVVVPAVGSTSLAGLNFKTSCILNIKPDGTVEVDKEGVWASDSSKRGYVSRKVTVAGRRMIVMVGLGGPADNPKDRTAAELDKAKAAAKAGDPKAKHFLRLKAAAETGNLNAMKDLASMYRDGYGIARNYTEAARWYLKTAQAGGHHTAMFNLGLMYERGQGVPKSRDEAMKWYRKAAAKGNKNAQRFLNRSR